MLKLGINATALLGKMTGVGYFAKNMILALAVDPKVELVLFAPGSLKQHEFEQYSNIKCVDFSIKEPKKITFFWRLKRFLIYTFCFQFWLLKEDISLFWSPSHGLPFFKPKGMRYIMTVHDLVYKRCPETMAFRNVWRERIFFPLAIKQADALIVDSHVTEMDLKHFFPHAKNITLIYPVMPIKHQPEKLASPILGKYILCLATKEPRKNLLALLEAYQCLPQEIRSAYHLVFCGGRGWKSDAFYQAYDAVSARGEVINFDYVNESTREALYQNASLFIFPTLHEGFGMPVIEAMSYGLPCLLSDIPIMREIGADAAIYFKLGERQNLTQALKTLLQAPLEFLEVYREKGRFRAQDFANNEAAIPQLLECFAQVQKKSAELGG